MVWIPSKLLITTIATTVLTAQAVIQELDASQFKLFGKPGHYEALIKKLDNALPNVSVAEVIQNTNHPNLAYDGPAQFIRSYT